MKRAYSTKLYILTFFVVFVTAILLRVLPIQNNNFLFTMDQARDMLDIRNIVIGKHLTLVGPTTSINGVFLGPFWYYFNVLPFVLSKGHPVALVYWMIGLYLIAGFSLFRLVFKKNPLLALISSSIFLLAPAMFPPSQYSWSANPMPPFVLFFFLSFSDGIEKPNIKSFLLAGFLAGLCMQMEAAFGILLIPFGLFYLLIKRFKSKYLLALLGGFLPTLLPQIFFELKHHFLMTNTLINELTGKEHILGENLSLIKIIPSHLNSFLNFNNTLTDLPSIFMSLLLLISVIFLSFQSKKGHLDQTLSIFFNLSIFFLIFAFLVYLLYPHQLKGWFLLGLYVPYIFIYSVFLTQLTRVNYLLFLPVSLLLLTFFIATVLKQVQHIPKDINTHSTDPSYLSNELEAVNWVYQNAQGQGFKVYNYIPSVYDFPYQYLFWWYGTDKYGYQPSVITYKDNVPKYILNNDYFWTKKKEVTDSSPVFLIYEKDQTIDRLYSWLGNFTSFCPNKKLIYPWGTTVEKRYNCQNTPNLPKS